MKLYSISELKDGRLFFDKKPPRFMTIFILFITICILGMFISSVYIPKSYIVNASGTATTSDNRYVSVDINGQIIEIQKNEGDYVQEGDLLFKVSDGKDNIQAKAIQPQIDTLKDKLSAMDVYESSLNAKVNYLENSGVQLAYYGKMEIYLATISTESYTKSTDSENLSELNSKLNSLYAEKESFQNQLNAEKDDAKKAELAAKVETKSSEIEVKQSEIKQAKTQFSNPSSQAAQIYQQLISELGEEKNNTILQLSQLEGQLSQVDDESELGEVKAENSGYLHYLTTMKVGVSLQLNQTVAEISQNNSEQYVVEANILAKDISKIKVGQTASIELQGVNSQKYGTLKGKIDKISSGTLIEQSNQGNIVYYQCTVSLDSTNLSTSEGETISIVKSMPVEARIIYNEETYFDWLRSLINLKN